MTAKNKKQAKPLDLKNVAVLMVEDDPFLRELYQRIFQRAEVQLTIVGDGETGYDHVLKMHPDLVILDVMLPGMTGLEVLEKIHKEITNPPTVVMLTDLDQIGVKEKALAFGAADFLSKNEVSGPELISRVERILQK